MPSILSLDPSFSGLAFSLYDGKDTVFIRGCSVSLGDNVGFERAFSAAREMDSLLYWELKELGIADIKPEIAVSEIPPPSGIYSAGLFALDTLLFDRLLTRMKSIKIMYTLPPVFLAKIHNTRNYKKSDCTALAKHFMDNVLAEYFTFDLGVNDKGKPNRLSNDKADSFLFLLRMFVLYDVKGLSNVILNEIMGYFEPSEKILLDRR